MNGNFYAPSILSHYWSEMQFFLKHFIRIFGAICISIFDHISSFIASFFISHNGCTNITKFSFSTITSDYYINFYNLLSKLSLSLVFPNLLNNDLVKSWSIRVVQKCIILLFKIIESDSSGTWFWPSSVIQYSGTTNRLAKK